LGFVRALPFVLLLGCGSPMFDSGSDDGGSDAAVDAGPPTLFSFFVTSLAVMQDLSGSEDGFGGNLGGIDGADAICQQAAGRVGEGRKTWRAFLSVLEGPDGGPVNAIDRIGPGPWYDRNERLVANDLAGLRQERPDGDPQTIDDLPDENGVALSTFGDTHDVMTGSNEVGELEAMDAASTCFDWTSAVGAGTEERAMCGHSWPAMSGQSWSRAHPMRGCAPGVHLVQDGPGDGDCVGCGGGWGGIYCFAVAE
jgi:hypothetical protein